MTRALHWFRIETARDGSIVNVTRTTDTEESRVRYLRAGNASNAIDRIAAIRAAARLDSSARANDRRVTGRCSGSGCRRRPPRGRRYCAQCAERTAASMKKLHTEKRIKGLCHTNGCYEKRLKNHSRCAEHKR